LRWRVEEVILHVKQSYNLEDVRSPSCNGLRNPPCREVTKRAYFVASTLSLRTKLDIQTRKLPDASQRIGNIIENLKYCALADGLKAVLESSTALWQQPKPPPSPQLAVLFPPQKGCPKCEWGNSF